jgi:hypothetical protein
MHPQPKEKRNESRNPQKEPNHYPLIIEVQIARRLYLYRMRTERTETDRPKVKAERHGIA